MIRKIKNKKGSAMQIAIIAILLVGTFATMTTSMVINQIKSNNRTSQNTDIKYDVEAGIDEVVAEFINQIEVEGKITELDILHKYVKLAYTMVGSNGVVDASIKTALANISQGTASKADLEMLIVKLGEAPGLAGGSNIDAKQLMLIARSYAQFFLEHFVDGSGKLTLKNIDEEVCREFILDIKYNLSDRVFGIKNGVLDDYGNVTDNNGNSNNGNSNNGNSNNDSRVNGNIGVVYRDSNTASNYSKNIDSIYKGFISEKTISSKIDELNGLVDNKEGLKAWANSSTGGKKAIEDIIKTEYTDKIENERGKVDNGGYIDEKEVKGNYGLTGNGQVDARQLSIQRLDIVKQEIDMLVRWIELMSGDKNGGDIGIGEEERLIVKTPKSINLSNEPQSIKNTKNINYVIDNIKIKPITLSSDEDKNKYGFEVLESGENIVLNLCIESQLDDYKIEANVDVIISEIFGEGDYNIDYEIKDWKKVNTN